MLFINICIPCSKNSFTLWKHKLSIYLSINIIIKNLMTLQIINILLTLLYFIASIQLPLQVMENVLNRIWFTLLTLSFCDGYLIK